MLQFTIAEALKLSEKSYDLGDHRLYLYRDGEVIFYAGKAENPFERMQSHMGLDWKCSPTPLGHLVQENAPDSSLWTLELYTVQDCAHFVEEAYRKFGGVQRYDVSIAEECMISVLRPCLNGTYNPHPSVLPERYRRAHARPGESSAQYLKM